MYEALKTELKKQELFIENQKEIINHFKNMLETTTDLNKKYLKFDIKIPEYNSMETNEFLNNEEFSNILDSTNLKVEYNNSFIREGMNSDLGEILKICKGVLNNDELSSCSKV